MCGCKSCKGITLLKGNGIVSTVDNNDGTFTFTYSDGSTFTTSDLTGATGPAGAQGIQGDPGVCECVTYDSDWVTINSYDAGKGYGLAALQNITFPKIRVVDKVVFIEGSIVIPLSDDAENGTTLLTSGNVYPSTYRASTRVYEGTLGGFTTNIAGSLTSTSPIIPSVLRPTLNHNFKSLQFSLRPVLSSSSAYDLNYTTILPTLVLTTDGKLSFSTLKDTYDSASSISGALLSTPIQNNPLLELITRAEAGDTVQDYSAYKTSFTAAVDQRITSDGLAVFPSAIDATDEKQLGGFYVNITMSYPLGDTVTEQQIIDAITEIQA